MIYSIEMRLLDNWHVNNKWIGFVSKSYDDSCEMCIDGGFSMKSKRNLKEMEILHSSSFFQRDNLHLGKHRVRASAEPLSAVSMGRSVDRGLIFFNLTRPKFDK